MLINIIMYFSFSEKIAERSEFYRKKYGLVPEFKAGVHLGKVIISEMGEIKKEIALNGDTMNTASRIESECNRLQADILVSEELMNKITAKDWIKPTLKGKIQLKGKVNQTNLYAIEKIKTG